MASQPLEEPSNKIASDMVRQIDGTLNRVNPNQLNAMIDLAAALPPEKQYSKNAQKTSQKWVLLCVCVCVCVCVCGLCRLLYG